MVKKGLRYVQGTKSLMLTYRKSDSLHIEGYSDSNFARDEMIENSHQAMHLLSQEKLYRGKAPSKPPLHCP
jgi:hypothetical protein